MLQKTNRGNRQVQRTKGWIFEALLLLLDEKQYSKINVSDICKKAGIARPTFYRNYKEKDDILFDCFLTMFKMSVLKAGENQQNAIVLTISLTYMIKNFDILKKLSLNMDIEKRFSPLATVFPESLIEEFKSSLTPDEYLICRYMVYYQIIGSLWIISDWLKNDMPIPIENLVEILNRLTIPKEVQYPNIPNVVICIDDE
ncbi:MAG: TetR/AcrR family transcriptional regulator [Treponema sp.]|jgi:AcrR family transcriptional regulator|nr:TetR/AcrR family transcriptional regulator [Treponema sp.]